MTERKLAIFRFDASTELGGGHAVRCSALADELAENGWQCRFATSSEAIKFADSLHQNGTHRWENLARSAPSAADLREAWPDGCDLFVVDDYKLDHAFETACRGWAALILAIDDLADRVHDCDVLVDQTLGRHPKEYADLVPDYCLILSGTQHALLRRQFLDWREISLQRRRAAPPLRRINVSLGYSPRLPVITNVLRGIAETGRYWSVDLLLGAAAELHDRVAQLGETLGIGVTIVSGTPDVAEMLANADIAIGSAGSSSWERCCLGVPSLVTVAAPNQECIASALKKHDAAVILGVASKLTPQTITDALTALLGEPNQVLGMSERSASLCDGVGVRRVFEKLDGLVTSPAAA